MQVHLEFLSIYLVVTSCWLIPPTLTVVDSALLATIREGVRQLRQVTAIEVAI